jgi:hypothetical protein
MSEARASSSLKTPTESVQHLTQFTDEREGCLDRGLSRETQFQAQRYLGVQLGQGTFGVRDRLDELPGRVPSLPFRDVRMQTSFRGP